MKILEIIQSLASGGAERLVVDLCNELSNTEEVILLLLKDVEHFYLPQVSTKVKIIEAKIPVGGGISQLWDCYKLIDRINPDIVHYHSYARYNVLLANILLGRKYKFYMTIHSDVTRNYTRGKSGFQVKIAGYLGNCSFVTISPTNYEQFKESHPSLRQSLIPNGRALPKFSSQLSEVEKEMNSFRINEETMLFIHVARYHPCKNQSMLIDAFNELINKGRNIALVVVGANFDCNEGKKIVEKACKNIHFVGLKSNVFDYLYCADTFCLSSIYEGMPMTVIEAILSGLPIISTPVCGVVDVVSNGINGYVADGYSKESYMKAIDYVLKNIVEIKKNALLAKKSSPVSISVCAKQYIALFSQKK